MAERREGVAAPNQRQGQNQQNQQQNQQLQQQIQDPVGQQQHLHINWSNFKPVNLMKMQKHICFVQMIG